MGRAWVEVVGSGVVVVEVGDEVEDLEEVSSGGGGTCDKKFLLRVKAGETAVTLLFVAKMSFSFYEKNEKFA